MENKITSKVPKNITTYYVLVQSTIQDDLKHWVSMLFEQTENYSFWNNTLSNSLTKHTN